MMPKPSDPTDNVLQFPSPKLEQHGEYTVGSLPKTSQPADLVGRFLFIEDKTQHITVRSCPGADAWCLTPTEAEALAVELIAQATKARIKMEHDDNAG